MIPLLPLSFDRVNNGRPPKSKSPLFQLPTEVLGLILQHVEVDSLASLALVDLDCCLLARSRQFASIKLDYSSSSSELVEHLALDGPGQQIGKPTSSLPSIGNCIRRIVVATQPAWITHRHGVSLRDDKFQNLPEHERTQKMVDASNAFFGRYIPAIANAVAALPHLELLHWEDMAALPRSLFEGLSRSTIKHLKFERVMVDKEFSIGGSSTIQWPLRTLHLDIIPSMKSYDTVSTSTLIASILHLTSSALEDLTIQTITDKGPLTFDVGKIPLFPNLRRLAIGRLHLEDSSVLDALMSDSLRHLAVRSWGPMYVAFFKRRGTIPYLESFTWEGFRDNTPPMEFMKANTKLSLFAMPKPSSSIVLETQIIPLLSRDFKDLTSLSLVWGSLVIPESALATISSMKTLNQINLSAGLQHGWKHDWLIDHESMRHHLRTLPLLERIAYSRDSYRDDLDPSGGEYYLRSGRFKSQAKFKQAVRWERKHLTHVLGEADQYAHIIPRLQWIYFGKIPMFVESNLEFGPKRVYPECQKRDECWTLLRQMFGGWTD